MSQIELAALTLHEYIKKTRNSSYPPKAKVYNVYSLNIAHRNIGSLLDVDPTPFSILSVSGIRNGRDSGFRNVLYQVITYLLCQNATSTTLSLCYNSSRSFTVQTRSRRRVGVSGSATRAELGLGLTRSRIRPTPRAMMVDTSLDTSLTSL